MELKQKSWIFDYPKLTQHALEAEAPTHNLGIWKRIQGGTALALEDPIDFDPRADYWFRPERRFLVAYLERHFSRWPEGRNEPRFAEFLLSLSESLEKRSEQGLMEFGHHSQYCTPETIPDALTPLTQWIDALPLFSEWASLKVGHSHAANARQSLQLFRDALLKDGFRKHEKGISRRFRWFSVLGAQDLEELERRERFFAAYANATMSHNSYRKAGSQYFGPILGNTPIRLIMKAIKNWQDGQSTEQAPLLGHDKSSEKQRNFSDSNVVRELWGFYNLHRQPFYNNKADAYTAVDSDPDRAVGQIGKRTHQWLESHPTETEKLAQRLEELIKDPKTKSDWKRAPLRGSAQHPDYDFDNRFYEDLNTAAIDRAASLSLSEKAALLLHLTQDQMAYAGSKEDDSPIEPSPPPPLIDPSARLRTASRVWLYAPGAKASRWDADHRAGKAAIGYVELNDLRDYLNEEEVLDALREASEGESEPTVAARTCWRFANEVLPGHWIIARNGRSRVIGIGVVDGAYDHDLNDDFPHFVKVHWIWSGDYTIRDKKTLPVATLTDCTKRKNLLHELDSLLRETVDPLADDEEAEAQPYEMSDALADLFLPDEQVKSLLSLLKRKLNVILQGPPGVGKTFVAKRLAYLLLGARDEDRVRLVQFHQAYTYEQFVRGFQPDGKGGFELANGPFFELAELAKSDPDNAYVLIIDEINRGNLSKILGEGMMLLEADKRSEEWGLQLAYTRSTEEEQETPFYLPPNLHVIGTMNTADRSLALVDYALRRRFSFMELRPGLEHPRFREHLEELPDEFISELQKRLRAINARIEADPNLGGGFLIGHSYFCRSGDSAPWEPDPNQWIDSIYRYEVRPLLEEYWYDDASQLESALQELGLRAP